MSDVNEYLDSTFNTKQEIPVIVDKYEKTRKSKIELAGENVIKHIIELAQTTDMTYQQISDRINETYSLDLTRANVMHFFRTNRELLDTLAKERQYLNKIRADLHLEYNSNLVKDIKKLDEAIDKLEDDDFMENKDKYRLIGELIDKKGKLLLRYNKLEGKLDKINTGSVENMQVNIFGNSEKKSEIMDKLRKVKFTEPTEEKVIEANNEKD